MNIKLVRLVTGEDILTEYTDAGTDAVFTNPLIVYIRPTETGVPSVGMNQWVPYASSKEFTIDKDKIVFVADAAEDLTSQYDKVFGSGIIMPSQGLVGVK
jgi:hypothetical protein